MKIRDEFLLLADSASRQIMEKTVLSSPEITKTVIGKSILAGEIPAYHIGHGRRIILCVGTHHALESITANFLYYMVFLLGDRELFRSVCRGIDRGALLSSFHFLFIPCLNPDGVEMRLHGAPPSPLRERQIKMSGGDFTHWQANSRGVDLNHNYNAGFFEYKKLEREKGISPGATLYSGEHPESEPETRALAGVVRALRPSLTLSLHTQGEEIYHSAKAAHVAARLSRECGYRIMKAEGTSAYGGLTDYLDTLGLSALTLELGKGANPLPETDLFSISERLISPLLCLPTKI